MFVFWFASFNVKRQLILRIIAIIIIIFYFHLNTETNAVQQHTELQRWWAA